MWTVKSKAELCFVIFFIIVAFTLLHYAESKFLSEDEAKLLGSSLCVCQNLNVNVCVSFRTWVWFMFRYNYTSNYTCYHYQHSYLNSEAEGFATLRDNQGIVNDRIEPQRRKIPLFPCLCKHVTSRLVQPSTFILCCTNCKTTILSLNKISHENDPYFTPPITCTLS